MAALPSSHDLPADSQRTHARRAEIPDDPEPASFEREATSPGSFDQVSRVPEAEEPVPVDAMLQATLEVALAASREPLVLAVSGGLDSMALLQAMARWAPSRVAAVATFDHGTGDHATEAASLVAAQARRLGLTVVRERARTVLSGEAAWRRARWLFLDRVARGFRGRVATAHTRDDHVETVVMRFLRGSGARGLAALAAPSRVVRPWLSVSRAELARWVREQGIPYLEDPMNAERRFLRGRVRHDLLPALEAASPGLSADLQQLADRAARWRRDVDGWLDDNGLEVNDEGQVLVPTALLEATTEAGRAVLWPAICARAGVTLDAAGTRAAVRFTMSRRRGALLPLAGGALLLRRGASHGEVFEVRRHAPVSAGPVVWEGTSDALPPRFGRWRFRRVTESGLAASGSSGGTVTSRAPSVWLVALPAARPVVVRTWRAGDRIVTMGAPAGRRVTRYFSESRVPVPDRPHWPVVLVDDVPFWVPGVCCAVAAPFRPGRSDLIWYRCERELD